MSKEKKSILNQVYDEIEKSCNSKKFNSKKFEEMAGKIDAIGHLAHLAEIMAKEKDFDSILSPIQAIIRNTKDLSNTEHEFFVAD